MIVIKLAQSFNSYKSQCPGSLDNPAPLTVGGYYGGGQFDGDLDEIAIFRRALNALDVKRLYQGGWPALGAD